MTLKGQIDGVSLNVIYTNFKLDQLTLHGYMYTRAISIYDNNIKNFHGF